MRKQNCQWETSTIFSLNRNVLNITFCSPFRFGSDKDTLLPKVELKKKVCTLTFFAEYGQQKCVLFEAQLDCLNKRSIEKASQFSSGGRSGRALYACCSWPVFSVFALLCVVASCWTYFYIWRSVPIARVEGTIDHRLRLFSINYSSILYLYYSVPQYNTATSRVIKKKRWLLLIIVKRTAQRNIEREHSLIYAK